MDDSPALSPPEVMARVHCWDRPTLRESGLCGTLGFGGVHRSATTATSDRIWSPFPVWMYVSITVWRIAARERKGARNNLGARVEERLFVERATLVRSNALLIGRPTKQPSHCTSHPAAAKSRYENVVRDASCFIVGILLMGRALRRAPSPPRTLPDKRERIEGPTGPVALTASLCRPYCHGRVFSRLHGGCAGGDVRLPHEDLPQCGSLRH